jgi:hypothetical protein
LRAQRNGIARGIKAAPTRPTTVEQDIPELVDDRPGENNRSGSSFACVFAQNRRWLKS